jgi:hypothetical protein
MGDEPLAGSVASCANAFETASGPISRETRACPSPIVITEYSFSKLLWSRKAWNDGATSMARQLAVEPELS